MISDPSLSFLPQVCFPKLSYSSLCSNLIHFWSKFLFYTALPENRRLKTSGFLVLSGSIKWENWLLAIVNILFKLNPSVANFPILYSIEKARKPDVFRY